MTCRLSLLMLNPELERADSVQISDAGLEMLKKSINATSEGTKVPEGNINIFSQNTEYFYRACLNLKV